MGRWRNPAHAPAIPARHHDRGRDERRFAAAQARSSTVRTGRKPRRRGSGLLRARQIDGYVADRDLLIEMVASRGSPDDLPGSPKEYLDESEPYALAIAPRPRDSLAPDRRPPRVAGL
jgi:hypothetical protein